MTWSSSIFRPRSSPRSVSCWTSLVFQHLSPALQPKVRLLLDLVGLAFFLFLTWFGVGMTVKGASQYATIFHMTMAVPFASAPVPSAVTAYIKESLGADGEKLMNGFLKAIDGAGKGGK